MEKVTRKLKLNKVHVGDFVYERHATDAEYDAAPLSGKIAWTGTILKNGAPVGGAVSVREVVDAGLKQKIGHAMRAAMLAGTVKDYLITMGKNKSDLGAMTVKGGVDAVNSMRATMAFGIDFGPKNIAKIDDWVHTHQTDGRIAEKDGKLVFVSETAPAAPTPGAAPAPAVANGKTSRK